MSKQERSAKAKMLLTILATAPAFIFDMVDYTLWGEYHIHPLLVERLLYTRNQFDGFLSIEENIKKHYGTEAAKLVKELI